MDVYIEDGKESYSHKGRWMVHNCSVCVRINKDR